MAPKRSKVQTEDAAAKKPKLSELDMTVERVVTALDNDFFGVEDAAKKTLSSTLPSILTLYKSQRHGFQTQLVVFMEQTFAQIQERLEGVVSEHEGFVQESNTQKEQHEAEKLNKLQVLEANTTFQQEKETTVEDFRKQTNDAETVYKAALAKHAQVTKDKDTLGGEKEKIEKEIELFNKLKTGVEKKEFKATISAFETAMRRNSITTAAIKAIPAAFTAEPKADFDVKTIDYVEEKLKLVLSDIESRIENWEPNMQEATKELEEAQIAFENLKETLAEAITIMNDAEKETKTTKTEISGLDRTLKSDASLISKKEKELKTVADRLEHFMDIKRGFEFLRDREERVEVVETEMAAEVMETVEA